MKIGLLLTTFLLLSGCTVFQKRREVELDPIKQKVTNVTKSAKVIFRRNGEDLEVNNYHVTKFRNDLAESLSKHNCPLVLHDANKPENDVGATILIETYTDERFSNWKPYVTGLSVGLVPVKYNYEYDLQIQDQGKILVQRKELVSGWYHLLFVFLLFSKSKTTIENEIYESFGKDVVRNFCST